MYYSQGSYLLMSSLFSDFLHTGNQIRILSFVNYQYGYKIIQLKVIIETKKEGWPYTSVQIELTK